MPKRTVRLLLMGVLLGLLGAAFAWVNLTPSASSTQESNVGADGQIEFADNVQSNAKPEANIVDFEFTDTQGKKVKLRDLIGKKNLVLAVMRGQSYYGTTCPYCSTQTSRMIANYGEFQSRNAEVVILFPVEKAGNLTTLQDYQRTVAKQMKLETWKSPFPLLLDVELKAINNLGIRGNLAKPATYIFDTRGQVRFAYVGKLTSDRPSVKAMLRELDAINKAG